VIKKTLECRLGTKVKSFSLKSPWYCWKIVEVIMVFHDFMKYFNNLPARSRRRPLSAWPVLAQLLNFGDRGAAHERTQKIPGPTGNAQNIETSLLNGCEKDSSALKLRIHHMISL
jgi:hypothetical protein